MTRKLIAVLGLVALSSPALADEAPYYDEQSGAWVNGAPPPEQPQPQYAPAPESNVDVSVDLAAPGASVTFGTFEAPLAQYGQWVTTGPYGRVWRPTHVAAGWRPYFYGRWEWTDEGWLWVSDEPWGWAAYHYGRWANDPNYGWVWVPGYQWAPAWVTWRYSPEYIGWAPLGPGFSVYVTSYPVNYAWWTFVPCRRFVGVPIHSVAYTGGYVRGIFRGTYPAPPRATMYGVHAPAWGGPARPFVEQRTGHPIVPVRLQPVASPAAIHGPARPGIVPVYRPETRMPSVSHGPAPAPAPGHIFNHGVASPQPGVRAAPAPLIAPHPSPGKVGSLDGARHQAGPAPARPATSLGASGAPQQRSAPGATPTRPQATFAPAPARPPQGSVPAGRPQQMGAPVGGAPHAPQGSPPGPGRPPQVRTPAQAPAPAPARPQGFAPPASRPQRVAVAPPPRAPAFAAAVPARAPAMAGRAHPAPQRR